MKALLILFLTLLMVTACDSDSPKVKNQKAIYFSISEVPRRELEKELSRTMEIQNLDTPGKAMLYLLDKNIALFPQIDAFVNQAASNAGVTLPPQDPLDEAENRIKVTRQIRSMLDAREAISHIEAEVDR